VNTNPFFCQKKSILFRHCIHFGLYIPFVPKHFF